MKYLAIRNINCYLEDIVYYEKEFDLIVCKFLELCTSISGLLESQPYIEIIETENKEGLKYIAEYISDQRYDIYVCIGNFAINKLDNVPNCIETIGEYKLKNEIESDKRISIDDLLETSLYSFYKKYNDKVSMKKYRISELRNILESTDYYSLFNDDDKYLKLKERFDIV